MEPFNGIDYVVAVSGGSGSGKTTLVRALQEAIGVDCCDILSQDSYYYDATEQFDFDGGSINFDHPASIEFSLMSQHLQSLREGDSVRVPEYCFKTHARVGFSDFLPKKPILLVDGILLLSQDEVLPQFDLCVFVDAAEEIRFSRRLNRDVRERGRSPEGVQTQFQNQVKPMHDRFVEPSKDIADIVCDGTKSIQDSVAKVLVQPELVEQLQRVRMQSSFDSALDKFVPHSHPTPV